MAFDRSRWAGAALKPHAGSSDKDITGHCVNTATLGWVGAPDERTPPLRVDDAVVALTDRCRSRTRNLAASDFTSAA